MRGGARSTGSALTWRRADASRRCEPQVPVWTPPRRHDHRRSHGHQGARDMGRAAPVRGPARRRSSRKRAGPSPTSSVSACSSARPRRGVRASPRSARRKAAGSRRRRSSRPAHAPSPSRAALANGTMALGFEYADFGAGSRPYPFAVTGPLAVAEAEHRSGKELALAIVIGYEVMGRVFHATFERGKSDPVLRPVGLRHARGRGRLRPPARAVARAHQLRARPGGGVHRRHVPRATRRARGSGR